MNDLSDDEIKSLRRLARRADDIEKTVKRDQAAEAGSALLRSIVIQIGAIATALLAAWAVFREAVKGAVE